MSEHTPEPWSIIKENCQSGDIGSVHGDDGWFSINAENWAANGFAMSSEANARRIVACVNACRGIRTKTLEECSSSKNPGINSSYEKIISQRDELLAALKYHQEQTRPIQQTINIISKYEKQS